MATTQNTFNGNGSNLGPFLFTFKWLESTDIKVSVGGVLKTAGTHYNLQNLNYNPLTGKTGGEVLFTAGNAPPAGTSNIRIYRDTSDEVLSAVFSSGSAIRARDLNDNFTQNLYITQEVNDNYVDVNGTKPMAGNLNMNGFQITNLPTPNGDNTAATKKYVDDRLSDITIPGHTRWRKAATSNQTTFSGIGDYGGTLAYSAGREQVYINGALQQRNVDYTADNGTSIVFSVGLTVGDVVDIICVNNVQTGVSGNSGNVTYDGQFSNQVTRSVANRLADTVSVKDFGAAGNANNDDTSALQAAFSYAASSGKAVYIPSGVYLISAPLRTGTTGPAFKIIGDGSLHSVIVQQTPNANGIEHDYNPITVSVAGTTCTVTCQYPHNLSSGLISLPLNKGPVSRLPKAFLGPKTITVTSSTQFTFAVANGTTTPGSQTGFLTPGYARALSIEGIAIKVGQLPGATASIEGGNAFIVALEGNGPYTSRWDDVLVMGWNANGSNSWRRGATIYGPTNMYWTNVTMFGRNSFVEQTPADSVALKLSTYSSQAAGTSGAVDGAYNSKFFNLELNYWTKAIELCSEQQQVITTDETHGLEGIVFDSVESGAHHFCSHTNNIWSTTNPTQLGLSFKFINCNAELSGYAYDLNGVSNVDISGGTLLMNGGEKGNIPVGENINYDINKFVNCENIKINGTEYVVFFTVGQIAGYTGTKGYLFNFANGSAGMVNKAAVIEGTRWTVQDAGTQDVQGGLYVGSQSQGIRELASVLVTYTNQGPIFTRQAGATNCFSQAYAASITDGNKRVTCDEYGNVFLNGQVVVTTDANREAVITWPSGFFSVVDPFIQVQFNDADTADIIGYHIPAVDLDTVTTSSVTIRYSSTSGMDNKTHRVAYLVSGKA